MNASEPVLLYATGDIGPCRDDPASMFTHVRDELTRGDILFGQLEPVLTARGEPMPQTRLAMRSPPRTAAAIRDAGFDVISFASNHCMDWGRVGLIDTLDTLAAAGIKTVGAGLTIAAARAPAVVERHGQRIAFLAYCSILPVGYWAEDGRAGCAPMRAWTRYEQIEHDQPGTPARIHTFAHREDLDAMRADIEQARKSADCVVVSMHWGIHFVPGTIAQYQREVGHAAIDAGAQIVLGHHPHLLKGVEVYRNKAIFYSLGNFALEAPGAFLPDLKRTPGFKEISALARDWGDDDPLPPETMRTVLVKCVIDAGSIIDIRVQPAYINRRAEPTMLNADDPRFSEVADYLRWATHSEGLNGVFDQDGAHLVLRNVGGTAQQSRAG